MSLKGFHASKSDVIKIINDLSNIVRRIDKLWEPHGMSAKELKFWTKQRSDLIRVYMHTRHKYM